jgi:hypothetical protein
MARPGELPAVNWPPFWSTIWLTSFTPAPRRAPPKASTMLPLLLVIVPLLRTSPPRITRFVSPRLIVPPGATVPVTAV